MSEISKGNWCSSSGTPVHDLMDRSYLGTLDGDLTRHQDRVFLEAVIGVYVLAALADDRVHRVELLAINSRLATESGSTLHVVAVCLNRIGKE